jgi:hypothetical protein
VIKRDAVCRAVPYCMEGMKNAYIVLAVKPGEKSQLGKSRCRLEDNIKMELKEMGREDVDWIHLEI